MRKILPALVAVILLTAAPVLAYYTCSTEIIVTPTSQTCKTTCTFYDNETGDKQGYWTLEFKC